MFEDNALLVTMYWRRCIGKSTFRIGHGIFCLNHPNSDPLVMISSIVYSRCEVLVSIASLYLRRKGTNWMTSSPNGHRSSSCEVRPRSYLVIFILLKKGLSIITTLNPNSRSSSMMIDRVDAPDIRFRSIKRLEAEAFPTETP